MNCIFKVDWTEENNAFVELIGVAIRNVLGIIAILDRTICQYF